MVGRAFIIAILIAIAEVLQGILRVRFLNRRVGDHRARQIGVGAGSAVILSIAWPAIPWIGTVTLPELLGVGLLWLVLMLALDFASAGWSSGCRGAGSPQTLTCVVVDCWASACWCCSSRRCSWPN